MQEYGIARPAPTPRRQHFYSCDVGIKTTKTVFAIGKSILNRSSTTNVGELCLSYGGGGHEKAGTCQVENEAASEKLDEIIEKIRVPELATASVRQTYFQRFESQEKKGNMVMC